MFKWLVLTNEQSSQNIQVIIRSEEYYVIKFWELETKN